MDASPNQSWIGRTLGGRYQILEMIGEGGMGVIYRARQLSVDREVAIKMLHSTAAMEPKWVERFHSETRACSRLSHPNTIRLYDFGQTTRGGLYMVMELLRGRSLAEVIRADAPMEPARVLRILIQCCASLTEAHQAGIIHRDIKPDNIFLLKYAGATDYIKLFDFSIAKHLDVVMTAAGMVMGTPQFMAPEQGRGTEVDYRADIYALGAVAYTMLCGKMPFNDPNPIEVLKMHQHSEVPPLPPSVPSSVASLVRSCLSKDAADRPQSAPALLEAAKVWLAELEPHLDVESDPILKNTLLTSHPTDHLATLLREEPPATSTPNAHSKGGKTVLSASGASIARRAGSEHGQSSASSIRATSVKPAPARPPAPEPSGPHAGQVHSDKTAVHRQPVPMAPAPVPAASTARPAPLAEQTRPEQSRMGFAVLCVLVALTFGLGGYYLTAALR